MPDDIDDIINGLKAERNEALQNKVEELKLKEALVLLEEKNAALDARIKEVRGNKLKGKTALNLTGRVIKGIGTAAWHTAKALHRENQQVRAMEARAVTRRRVTNEELR